MTVPKPGRAEHAAALMTDWARHAEPGTRLGTKSELRERCDVSPGTFNEALRLLRARGQVTVRPGPGGGIFTTRPSPLVRLGQAFLSLGADRADMADAVADAVRIRNALDPLLVEDALAHAAPADYAEVRVHLAGMAEAAEAGDPVAFVRANWRLHAALAALSPNRLLTSMYTSLLDLLSAHTQDVLPDPDHPRDPLDEYVRARHRLHADLVDALERGERTTALRLIAEHNTTAR